MGILPIAVGVGAGGGGDLLLGLADAADQGHDVADFGGGEVERLALDAPGSLDEIGLHAHGLQEGRELAAKESCMGEGAQGHTWVTPSDLLIVKVTALIIRVVSVAVLLPGTGSTILAGTAAFAVLVINPVAPGNTIAVTV